MPDTVGAQNAVEVSGFDCLSSEGGFEVKAADWEAVDASGNVDGLFPIVLRFAEWAPTKTSADFEVEAASDDSMDRLPFPPKSELWGCPPLPAPLQVV